MDAVRFTGDRQLHLTTKSGSCGTLCGWYKWDVAERWPAEFGVPTTRLCDECRREAEANAEGRSIYKPRPKRRRMGFVEHHKWVCEKYGLDPKDPLGIL